MNTDLSGTCSPAPPAVMNCLTVLPDFSLISTGTALTNVNRDPEKQESKTMSTCLDRILRASASISFMEMARLSNDRGSLSLRGQSDGMMWPSLVPSARVSVSPCPAK